MTPMLVTALLFCLFTAGFWASLRFVPGKVGRKTFFFGVLAVTLVGWFVIADTAATTPSLALEMATRIGVAITSGLLIGALAISFARWLNRSRRFAWVAIIPFALPIMALMEPLSEPADAV